MKRIFLFLILILIVAAASFRLWFPRIGTFLTVRDQLRQADCIVVLQGDDFFRIQKAVDLYDRGYAPKILYSPLFEMAGEFEEYYYFYNRLLGAEVLPRKEEILRAFAYFGKDEEDLYFTDVEVSSTFDEALAAKDWILDRGVKSFLLVTSSYHMRRALVIYRWVFRGTGIRIYPVTAKNPLHVPEQWWRKERDVKMVFEEYFSILFNLIYHIILGKETTSFDTV